MATECIVTMPGQARPPPHYVQTEARQATREARHPFSCSSHVETDAREKRELCWEPCTAVAMRFSGRCGRCLFLSLRRLSTARRLGLLRLEIRTLEHLGVSSAKPTRHVLHLFLLSAPRARRCICAPGTRPSSGNQLPHTTCWKP